MLEIGSLVDGKYKILNQIGKGGMSVVYMAINEKANKTWAVKEVRKDGVLEFEAVKQGLVAETDILKKLNHPNLPSIIDVIDSEDSFIIIMDYVQGNSLSETLKEYGAQTQEYVIEWAKQLCDVLGYLHSRQKPIIYRDMKPSNIMLNPDGKVFLIDFGTAREFKEKNLADTTCLGTAGYAAPEQYGGMGQTDARTDIYGLGATLYHLVTGRNPSEPPYEIKPIREVNPSLSSGFERIILKCTQRNPDERYQSAAELMYALEHYEEIDDKYRKKQKKKLALFLATVSFSVLFAITGTVFNYAAIRTASDTYAAKMDKANKTSDFEDKIQLLEECIAIPGQGGNLEAYLELIKAFKENDSLFTLEEAKLLEKLISNNSSALKENPSDYITLCYETGKLFWYYYSYGDGSENQVTRAKSSIEWFDEVLANAPDDYGNKGMATVYSSVGKFYRDITTAITEASDKGKYMPLYNDLLELMNTVAKDENESEIVRLELIEMARSAIQQYTTKFKGDDVKKEELVSLLSNVEKTGMEIITTTDQTDEKKARTLALIPDTREAIETAYGTKGGD